MDKNKNVFWEALLIALFVFVFGILLGISFETKRIENMQKFSFDSQTNLFDFELSSRFVYNSNLECTELLKKSVFFADEIYSEAVKLEKYDSSNKLIKEAFFLHRRYDFLRTLLWEDILKVKERCGEINTIIYLYNYKDPSMNQRAVQGAMSNFLTDLKNKYGDQIILLPIAADTDLESLNLFRKEYDLEKVPVIFVNEKYKIENISSLKNIEKFLNK